MRRAALDKLPQKIYRGREEKKVQIKINDVEEHL